MRVFFFMFFTVETEAPQVLYSLKKQFVRHEQIFLPQKYIKFVLNKFGY